MRNKSVVKTLEKSTGEIVYGVLCHKTNTIANFMGKKDAEKCMNILLKEDAYFGHYIKEDASEFEILETIKEF